MKPLVLCVFFLCFGVANGQCRFAINKKDPLTKKRHVQSEGAAIFLSESDIKLSCNAVIKDTVVTFKIICIKSSPFSIKNGSEFSINTDSDSVVLQFNSENEVADSHEVFGLKIWIMETDLPLKQSQLRLLGASNSKILSIMLSDQMKRPQVLNELSALNFKQVFKCTLAMLPS